MDWDKWDQWIHFGEDIDNLIGVATLAPRLSLAQPKPTSRAVQRSARSCATTEECLCAACCALKSLCFPVDSFPPRPSSPVFFFLLRVFAPQIIEKLFYQLRASWKAGLPSRTRRHDGTTLRLDNDTAAEPQKHTQPQTHTHTHARTHRHKH